MKPEAIMPQSLVPSRSVQQLPPTRAWTFNETMRRSYWPPPGRPTLIEQLNAIEPGSQEAEELIRELDAVIADSARKPSQKRPTRRQKDILDVYMKFVALITSEKGADDSIIDPLAFPNDTHALAGNLQS